MEIAVCQMKIIPGNPRENYATMRKFIAEAKLRSNNKVDVVLFPELALPGYLIGDMWEEQAFIRDCKFFENKLHEYAIESGLTIVFGTVSMCSWKQHDGRPTKFNSLVVAGNRRHGELRDFDDDAFIAKTLLPNYREFDELRHFTPNRNENNIKPVSLGARGDETKFGFALCEDGWDDDYDIRVMSILASRGADILVNHSCSPFTVNKNDKRNRVFGAHAANAERPLIYVNSIGLQNNAKTVFSFDGCSVIYDERGNVLYESPMFEEDIFFYNTKTKKVTSNTRPAKTVNNTRIGDIYNALVFGIREYCAQIGVQDVVIGSSGGIDSAVSAALHVAALGREHVYLVNMPSVYNSETTKGLSHQLAVNLGTPYAVVPIGDSVDLTKKQINGMEFTVPTEHPCVVGRIIELSDFNMENVQARDRSSRILAAISSAIGGVFSNNGNKVECAVGYATLYGDVAGYLAVIADLWKEDVYLLGKYINHINGREIIPVGIFDIVASAELSANQDVDAGKGDPLVYWYHSRLIKSWIEAWNRKTPEDILKWYSDGVLAQMLDFPKNEFGEYKQITDLFPTAREFIDDLERWWKCFKGMGAAKRTQAPPVLAVTPRAFGFDYRDALNCVYFTEAYKELKAKLLAPIV